jgi:molybdopterin-binding protein
MLDIMPYMRIRDVAGFLGVSDDTVRRLVDHGSLTAVDDAHGRKVVDGLEVAMFARAQASTAPDPLGVSSSARNRFVGLVTDIRTDAVMAQVEMQCGPYRVVSLLSREAADELDLAPGVTAIASIKSTNVVVEVPDGRS